MEKVDRCADCGFLSVRMARSRQLVEAEPWMRKSGAWEQQIQNIDIYAMPGAALCFIRAADLAAEAQEFAAQGDRKVVDQRDWKAIMAKGRSCAIKWHQGFTPKEHQEMLDQQWMLKYQRDRERDDRNWGPVRNLVSASRKG